MRYNHADLHKEWRGRLGDGAADRTAGRRETGPRHSAQRKAASGAAENGGGGGGIEEKAPPEPAAPAPENKKEEVEEGYRGFLLVKCQNCGKIYAYNARGETTESTCRECGHVTPLRMLAQALFECPECGTKWNYKTNLTDADAACRCVRCGAEMRSRWHKNLRKYVPQE